MSHARTRNVTLGLCLPTAKAGGFPPQTPTVKTYGEARGLPKYRSAREIGERIANRLLPQWLRTLLALFIWYAGALLWVAGTCTYDVYAGGYAACAALGASSVIAPYLWPGARAPWRTVLIAYVVSLWTGAMLLGLGAGAASLSGAVVVGYVTIGLRANRNGRRGMLALWSFIQTRFGKIKTRLDK